MNDRGKLIKSQEAFPVRLDFDGIDVTSVAHIAREIKEQGMLEEEQIVLHKNCQVIRESAQTCGEFN